VVDLPRPDTREDGLNVTLPARPENIALIRQLLGAVAESIHLDEDLVDDLRLAVTEACTNVVRHAYSDGAPGPIELSVNPTDGGVRVVVTDRGRGMGPSPDTKGPGLGLPLIAAIAASVEIERSDGSGSRVAMSFGRPRHEAAA
jgi:anti-sigma regulatory factor (Ser/Thr protein kinase)